MVFSNVDGIRIDSPVKMWLKNVNCSGSEPTLLSCKYDRLVDYSCETGYWAAAVLCGGEVGH